MNVHSDDEEWYREYDGCGRFNHGAQPPSSNSLKDRSRSSSLSGKTGGTCNARGSASFRNRLYGLQCFACGSWLIGTGMYLFYNKALIRLGNLLFVCGIPLFFGQTKTIEFCMAPEKSRATGCFLMGIFLVFVGWPMSGIVLEMFGLLKSVGTRNSAAVLITSVAALGMYILCLY